MSLHRRCREGHDIAIYFGNRFLPLELRAALKTTGRRGNYIVFANGKILGQSNSLSKAETLYSAACRKVHKGPVFGPYNPFLHRRNRAGCIIDKIELPGVKKPTMDWLKNDIKAWMSLHDVEYNSGDTKADLLVKIDGS